MRALQRMADGLLGRFAPKVEASAAWWYQYKCDYNIVCSNYPYNQSQRYRRHCHDSGCYGWEKYGCC